MYNFKINSRFNKVFAKYKLGIFKKITNFSNNLETFSTVVDIS